MFKAMQMGLVSGMFIGLPIASYCFFLMVSRVLNHKEQKMCLVEVDQLRPIVYNIDIPNGMSNSIDWHVNFIAISFFIFSVCLIKVAFLKSKDPLYKAILGFSVILIGFNFSVYLPWCALFSEAHSYQVCAGMYLQEVFGKDYNSNEAFLKEKDFYALDSAYTLIITAKIYLTIFLLTFI